MAKTKKKRVGVNKSEFCRTHIRKVGIQIANTASIREAWAEAGHKGKAPTSTLFSQVKMKVRADNSKRHLELQAKKKLAKDAKTELAATSPSKEDVSSTTTNVGHDVPQESELISIETQLESLIQEAEELSSYDLADAIRQARRQAGVEILAAQ